MNRDSLIKQFTDTSADLCSFLKSDYSTSSANDQEIEAEHQARVQSFIAALNAYAEEIRKDGNSHDRN